MHATGAGLLPIIPPMREPHSPPLSAICLPALTVEKVVYLINLDTSGTYVAHDTGCRQQSSSLPDRVVSGKSSYT